VYLEVAERDSWKRDVTVLSPVSMMGQFAGQIDAERVVLGRQHDVQQEQLTDRVADVEDLRDEEQNQQIVAKSTSHTSPSYAQCTLARNSNSTPSTKSNELSTLHTYIAHIHLTTKGRLASNMLQ